MKHEVDLRIRVTQPITPMKVQRGRNELLDGTTAGDDIVFDFPILVDIGADVPNFLGKYAQGPRDSRFVYVNSGTYAGRAADCWSRRAKIPLAGISRNEIEKAIASPGDFVIETTFPGVGKDGGPTCATVKGIEWRVVAK